MDQLVSILIPVYNREDLVSETIESALNQTYKNLEIIIVDNHSTDNTWQVLKRYEDLDNRIRIFRNKENIGPVLNWKRCIEEANGYYSKILFSDDLISNNYLEETLKLFEENVAFVLSKIEIFDNHGNENIRNYRNKNEFTVNEYLSNILLINSYKFPVSPGAAIFRTSDLNYSLEVEINNPFNLDFKKYGAGNDLLLFLNISKEYDLIKAQNNAIAFFRSHNASLTISNELSEYYDYAKYHYILINKINLLNKFKVFVWYKNVKNIYNKRLYKLIDCPGDWIYLFKIIFK